MVEVKHSGNLGDVFYSLSVLQNIGEPIDLYLRLDVPSTYTSTSQHPVGSVMLNRAMFDMAYPLLVQQPYINSVSVYEGGEVDYDLDLFRSECKNLSGGDIKLWYCVADNRLKADTSKQVISVPPIKNDWVIFNRTIRYNNPLIDYTILEKLGKKLKFVGVESEFKIVKSYLPTIEHLVVDDFLQLAQYIGGCELFIGNQSMAFAIAEQMKVDRVLEQYIFAPNVIPQGGNWGIFHNQKQFEKIINGRNK